MKAWKLLGVAGLAGVAATGAVIARDERRRQELTPDDVRERLHQRHAAVRASGREDVAAAATPSRWSRLLGRLRSR